MVMVNLRSDFNPFQLFFHVGHDAVILVNIYLLLFSLLNAFLFFVIYLELR
jgi:hypothetical protein